MTTTTNTIVSATAITTTTTKPLVATSSISTTTTNSETMNATTTWIETQPLTTTVSKVNITPPEGLTTTQMNSSSTDLPPTESPAELPLQLYLTLCEIKQGYNESELYNDVQTSLAQVVKDTFVIDVRDLQEFERSTREVSPTADTFCVVCTVQFQQEVPDERVQMYADQLRLFISSKDFEIVPVYQASSNQQAGVAAILSVVVEARDMPLSTSTSKAFLPLSDTTSKQETTTSTTPTSTPTHTASVIQSTSVFVANETLPTTETPPTTETLPTTELVSLITKNVKIVTESPLLSVYTCGFGVDDLESLSVFTEVVRTNVERVINLKLAISAIDEQRINQRHKLCVVFKFTGSESSDPDWYSHVDNALGTAISTFELAIPVNLTCGKFTLDGTDLAYEMVTSAPDAETTAVCENSRWVGRGLSITELADEIAGDSSVLENDLKCNNPGASGRRRRRGEATSIARQAKTKSRRALAVIPKYEFRQTIEACPFIDEAVSRGKDKWECGRHGSQYHCDYWNLTLACVGKAAVLGSTEMVSTCETLCQRTPGCESFMLDMRHANDGGLCVLMEASMQLEKSCNVRSGALGRPDLNYCTDLLVSEPEVPKCNICNSDNPGKPEIDSLKFIWIGYDSNATQSLVVPKKGVVISNNGTMNHREFVTVNASQASQGSFVSQTVFTILDGGGSNTFRIDCPTGPFLGDALTFATGRLILVGFTTTNEDSELSLCNLTQSIDNNDTAFVTLAINETNCPKLVVPPNLSDSKKSHGNSVAIIVLSLTLSLAIPVMVISIIIYFLRRSKAYNPEKTIQAETSLETRRLSRFSSSDSDQTAVGKQQRISRMSTSDIAGGLDDAAFTRFQSEWTTKTTDEPQHISTRYFDEQWENPPAEFVEWQEEWTNRDKDGLEWDMTPEPLSPQPIMSPQPLEHPPISPILMSPLSPSPSVRSRSSKPHNHSYTLTPVPDMPDQPTVNLYPLAMPGEPREQLPAPK
eukprot:m.162322 g.162322  ORF g.162322 m.162322 type:complete len:985 (-) comp31276_c0_seq1:20-2974(-)